MGFYVRIEKVFESESSAKYSFKNEIGECGLLELNKMSNEVILLNSMPGDGGMHYFRRATFKITRELEKGELPQILEWAS